MNFKIELVGLVFRLIDQKLCVLLAQSEGERSPTWSLPSSPLERSKAPEDGLTECIQSLGFTTTYIEQLYSFADERSGIIRMAYIVLAESLEVNSNTSNGATLWAKVNRIPKLHEAHMPIKELGIQRLRNKVSYSRIATRLLPDDWRHYGESYGTYSHDLDR